MKVINLKRMISPTKENHLIERESLRKMSKILEISRIKERNNIQNLSRKRRRKNNKSLITGKRNIPSQNKSKSQKREIN